MSELRSPIRNTKNFGSTQVGIVEALTLGYATVRLVNNGVRLANLKVIGTNIQVGDQITVDYTTSGVPYVRSVVREQTVTSEIEYSTQIITDQQAVVMQKAPDVVICKATMDGEYKCPTVEGNWLDIHVPPIYWQKALIDTSGMLTKDTSIINTQGNHLTCQYPGRYLISYTIALSAPPPPPYYTPNWRGNISFVPCISKDYDGWRGWKYIGGRVERRWTASFSDNIIIGSASTITTLYLGETITIFLTLDIHRSMYEPHPEISLLYAENQYPIFEAWRISGIGDGPTSAREYIYNQ